MRIKFRVDFHSKKYLIQHLNTFLCENLFKFLYSFIKCPSLHDDFYENESLNFEMLPFHYFSHFLLNSSSCGSHFYIIILFVRPGSYKYMGNSPKKNLCNTLASFFNTIHFKLLKIGSCNFI